MSTVAFDTHKFVKELTSSGMPAEQAEVLADNFVGLLTDRLATKADIDQLRSEMRSQGDRLRGDIAAQEDRFPVDLKSLEDRLMAEMAMREERLIARIAHAQMQTIIIITGILGLLMVVLEYYL